MSSRTPAPRFSFLFAAALVAAIPFAPITSYAATYTVTAFTDAASGGAAGTGAGNAGDLRKAILDANASGGADTINFTCGSPPCTITLNGPLPPITDDLTIDGGTLGDIVIDGASNYRVFFVDTGTVTLTKLKIQNAKAKGGLGGQVGGAGLGGALFVNQAGANVTVSNMAFASSSVTGGAAGNNTDAGGGGAVAGPDIFVRLGTLTTTSSTSTGTCATGGSGGSASSGASFAGASGSAEGSPVFNFGGTVNSSTTVGAFTSALSTSSSTR